VELLSGPGGLASFLRRKLLGARLGGDSLPLDIGCSETVPAGIRNAVRHRALIVNPDGTTTAWNKDKTKVLHSHGPPARAG
jgi:hypothetical protein